MAKYALLAAPAMQKIAQEICSEVDTIDYIDIEWRRFPDTFPDTFISAKKSLKGKKVAFLACFDTPSTIFEQMSVIYDLAEFSPRSFRVILPYFPVGTMERKDSEGQIATASTLAQMLSAVAPSGPGPIPLYMWDVHALQIRHYFGQNISPRFKTATKLLKRALKGSDVTICYPDMGAFKRFRRMFQDGDGNYLFDYVICNKIRVGDERIVTVSEGKPQGRDVVIIDDLIHSGGTTIKCKDALMDAGANSVSAYATHGVMELKAWKKFLDAGFEKVWITDSCPATAEVVAGNGPFEVLSIKGQIKNAVTSR